MFIAVTSMNKIAASLATHLAGVQEVAQEYASALLLPAQLLCGLFAFIYIGLGLWGAWARGQKIDFYRLLRPFSVGLIVTFFAGFVSLLQLCIYPLELATSSLNESVADHYVQAQDGYQQTTIRIRDAMATYQRSQVDDANQEEMNHLLENETSSSYLETYKTVLNLLVSYSSLALTGMVYFFRTYVVLAGVVLLLIGPFAFALSLLPGFSDNIKNWVTHYVHIAMYVPLSLLVSFMVAVLFSECVYPVFTDMLSELPQGNYTFADYEQAENLQLSILHITLLFNSIAIALYACIPVFAKWILRNDSKKDA